MYPRGEAADEGCHAQPVWRQAPFKLPEGWVCRAVLRRGGSLLHLLLLPGEEGVGWGAMSMMAVTISEEKGEGSVREEKESREEGYDGC